MRDRTWVERKKEHSGKKSGWRPRLVKTFPPECAQLSKCHLSTRFSPKHSEELTRISSHLSLRSCLDSSFKWVAQKVHLEDISDRIRSSFFNKKGTHTHALTYSNWQKVKPMSVCFSFGSILHQLNKCDTFVQLENSGLNARLAKPQRKSVCMGNRMERAC